MANGLLKISLNEEHAKEKYEEMMPFIEKNFKLAQQLPIAEDYIYENYLKKFYSIELENIDEICFCTFYKNKVRTALH